MSQVRRRRALRSSVLAASLAVLASLVVAPPAVADDGPATTSTSPTADAPTPSATPAEDPSTSSAPTTVEPADTSSVAPAGADDPSAPETPAPGETVVGELQQAWPDPTAEEHEADGHDGHDDHAGEEPLSWIDTGDGTAVRVPTDALPDVAVGSTIAVTVGDEITDEASAEQGFAPAVEVQAATVLDAAASDPSTASAGSAPTNTVTAVLVLPAGASADGTTIASVVNTLNGDVSSFWDEQSNGTVRISAVQGAAGWISSTKGCDAPFALWNDVAQQIGWTQGAGKHLMLYVPGSAAGCAYGLGTVGSSIGSGGLSYVRAAKLSVMGHELGHNFGLGHSSELQCNSSLESGTCRTRDYYDFYDIMGISWDQVGTLNAVQAARLGLLPASEQVALTPTTAATTVALAPASATSGTRAVKLTASNGVVYYLEYRQAGGRDAWLGDARNQYRLSSGVVLRRVSSGGNTSLLLDGTPTPTSGWDGDMQQTLPVGSTTVVGGTLSVTVQNVSAGEARVRVAPVSRPPFGALDSVTTSGRTVTVSGWALDPDAPARSIAVHVYVDGVGVALQADQSRPDVAAVVTGAGPAHGFGATRSLADGAHTVCAYAIDLEGEANTVLGCRTVVVGYSSPIAAWESTSASQGVLTVSGWAVDPDEGTTPGAVHVYVDGRGAAVTADGSRPDVGRVFPGTGDQHGFSWSGAVTPGSHVVCVYAIDVSGVAANRSLGCQTVAVGVASPVGSWESTGTTQGMIEVTGWAFDPDEGTSPSAVHVYVDGVGRAVTANGMRPDVGRVFPGVGDLHGFGTSADVSVGVHSVCVYAIDATGAAAHTFLGCRSVTVGLTSPIAAWESATVANSVLSVSGWAFDPDDAPWASAVHVYVDGHGTALTADGSRPDVGRAFPQIGDLHGFAWSGPVSAGPHSVCVYAIDGNGAAAHTSLGCRSVG